MSYPFKVTALKGYLSQKHIFDKSPNISQLPSQNSYYIVDDDLDDQQFLIEALTENDQDAQCLTALNGSEAIRNLMKVGAKLPDAIFLDLNMPQLNGKECLRNLKRTPSLRHIPVIIYSTTTNQKEVHETLKMGASFFIVKKENFQELREELRKLIKLIKDLKPNI